MVGSLSGYAVVGLARSARLSRQVGLPGLPRCECRGSGDMGFGDEGVDVVAQGYRDAWSAAPRVGSPTSVASRWSRSAHAEASPELAVRHPINARIGTSGGSATGLPAVHHW